MLKGCRIVYFLRNAEKVIAKVCKGDVERKLEKSARKFLQFKQETVQELLGCLDGSNHVEALNEVSVASKQRISLSTQLQRMSREDRRRA